MKENEIASGVAIKVRGLDANGNSIVTSPQQVVDNTSCLQLKQLYGTYAESYYCKILTMTLSGSTEGNLDNIVLEIIGGNAYTVPNSLLYLSLVCHRETVKASKNSIIGTLSIGYVKNDTSIDIWVKTASYSNSIYVSILGRQDRNALIKNVYQKDVPEGYIEIN